MPVRVTVQGRPLRDLQWSTQETMRGLGEAALESIRSRTARGVDVNGLPFAAYSHAYSQAKARYRMGWRPVKGRKRQRQGAASVMAVGIGQRAQQPDLLLTGQMLGAMGIRALTDRRVSLGFLNARAMTKALAHDEDGVGKSKVRRRFFGLDQAFLDKATARIKGAWLRQ
jgi:hypothetical protein